ncbi:MAG: hypothetical protein BGO49_19880 [Planctomycetales bacterium 71-10]|nr:MAG: hypothetical protein BGO49_19880 [Planctomycetales bacterium 71-10]
MHRRAFRPEFSGCLEGRALASGFARPSMHSVEFSRERFEQVTLGVQLRFSTFARLRQVSLLRDGLADVVVLVPFRREDGLGESIERIVDRMEQGLASGARGAILSAQREVIATIHADVAARVRAGDVSLR